MKTNDFPSYFQAADEKSIASQKAYLLILKIDLIAMILAAGLAMYSVQSGTAKLWINAISGVFLLTGLVLTIIIKSKRFEDLWYQGRALAESCKTLTWRFVVCAEYFEIELSDNEVKERFINRIKEIAGEFTELTKNLSSSTLSKPIITEKMLELRKMALSERKSYYIKNRIEDQKVWYTDKADSNKKAYDFWFYVIIGCQALAILFVVVLLINPESNWNIVGLLTTLSASAISWLQIKQHQELKQAYTTATAELNFIKELSYNIESEEQLSEFVLDSENAVSREHTLWLAQRRE